MGFLFWAVTVVSAGLAFILLEVAKAIWVKPLRFKKLFEAQGIQGPSYKFIYGNAPDIVKIARQKISNTKSLSGHNIVPRVLPAFHEWSQTYGHEYVYWFGSKPRLYVPDPQLVREILSNKFGNYKRVHLNPKPMKDQGLAQLEGEIWAQHRKIINPSFHMDVLKGMIPQIAECGTNVIEEWKKLVSSGANEIDVLNEFSCLTSDVISRTAFGSSYAEGKYMFHLLSQRVMLIFERSQSFNIPGSRFLPTNKNMQEWWLTKEITKCARQVIESREKAVRIGKSADYGTDLLGLMMNANKEGGNVQNNIHMTTDEIISECITFYTAGHITTTVLLTWTMILLGMHQDWQERARKEVLELCGKNDFPNAETVNGLKIMGMIFNESLRLYPPAVALLRQTDKPVKLGRFSIPAGTQFHIPILAMHHDPAFWGDSVNEFNPERFREGISKAASNPNAFMPFSVGPKICIGQNFALLEAKVVLTMILQRFSFVISPNYIHAPVHAAMLKPQYGAQVILRMI